MGSRLYGRMNSDRRRTEVTAQGNYNMSARVEDWDRQATLDVAPNSHGENVVRVNADAKGGIGKHLLSINLTTGEVVLNPNFDGVCRSLRGTK